MHNDKGITEMLGRFGRYAVPAPAQQLLYARAVRAWLDAEASGAPYSPSIRKRGIRAKQRLTESNLRLVVSVANRFRRAWVNNPDRYQDVVQEGVLGLNRAIELFDPTRGYKFSTYAYWWIHRYQARAIEPLLCPVRVPESATRPWLLLSQLISNYEAEHGCRPSVDWLSQQTGFSQAAIERCCVIGRLRAIASLDEPIKTHDGEAGTLGDLVCYEEQSVHNDELDIEQQLQLETLHQLIPQLSATDQEIIHAIYSQSCTVAEAARSIGIRRETARQRGAAALRRLKRLAEANRLLPIAA